MTLDPLSVLLNKADNLALVSSLVAAGVEFVIIGGTALAHHGLRDMMQVDDLDLLVNPTRENAAKIGRVLQSLGTQLPGEGTALARNAVQLPLKNSQYWAEILTPVKGIDFNAVYSSATIAKVSSLSLFVANKEQLILMKEVVVNELRSSLEKHETDLQRLRDA